MENEENEVENEEIQRKKLSEMSDYEMILALNTAHNTIHQINEQKMIEAQNINSIMAEIKRRNDKHL